MIATGQIFTCSAQNFTLDTYIYFSKKSYQETCSPDEKWVSRKPHRRTKFFGVRKKLTSKWGKKFIKYAFLPLNTSKMVPKWSETWPPNVGGYFMKYPFKFLVRFWLRCKKLLLKRYVDHTEMIGSLFLNRTQDFNLLINSCLLPHSLFFLSAWNVFVSRYCCWRISHAKSNRNQIASEEDLIEF